MQEAEEDTWADEVTLKNTVQALRCLSIHAAVGTKQIPDRKDTRSVRERESSLEIVVLDGCSVSFLCFVLC